MNRQGNLKKLLIRPSFLGVVLLCACFSTGCKLIDRLKSKDGGGGNSGEGGSTPKYDPLIGRNIPKQDLPIPGRDGYADGKEKDPLLKNGNAKRNEDTEPYRSGPGTTPAALAAKPRDEAGVPSIDDRPTGTATGRGPVPFKTVGGTVDDTGLDQITAELRKYGATWQPIRRGKNGESLFTCDVPLGANGEGPIRRYEGVGASDSAAAKDVLNQILVELKK